MVGVISSHSQRKYTNERRAFIGGSDARVIMGDDGAALTRLWQEKRGEREPEDLSGNLVVQLGRVVISPPPDPTRTDNDPRVAAAVSNERNQYHGLPSISVTPDVELGRPLPAAVALARDPVFQAAQVMKLTDSSKSRRLRPRWGV